MLFYLIQEFYSKVQQYLKISDWYVWVHMDKGQITMPIFQSLDAYWPGLQVSDSCQFFVDYHAYCTHQLMQLFTCIYPRCVFSFIVRYKFIQLFIKFFVNNYYRRYGAILDQHQGPFKSTTTYGGTLDSFLSFIRFLLENLILEELVTP